MGNNTILYYSDIIRLYILMSNQSNTNIIEHIIDNELTDIQKYRWAKDIWDNLSFHERTEVIEKAGFEVSSADRIILNI